MAKTTSSPDGMMTIIKFFVYSGVTVLTVVAGFYVFLLGRIAWENNHVEERVMAIVRSVGNDGDGGAQTMEVRRTLTERILARYDATSDDALTTEAEQAILWGVEHEGLAPRWVEHEDPTVWAHNSIEQSRSFYHGSYTWEDALYTYVQGDAQRSYEALGHVLHLVIDAAMEDRGWDAEISNIDIPDSMPSTFASLDEAFDSEGDVIRNGAGVIVLFHREAAALEERVSRGESLESPPTIYTPLTEVPTSIIRTIAANIPRVMGTRPETPIVVEDTPIAIAVEQEPIRPLTRHEIALLQQTARRFFMQVVPEPRLPRSRGGRRATAQKPKKKKNTIAQKEESVLMIEKKEDLPPLPLLVEQPLVIQEALPTLESAQQKPPESLPPPPPPIVYCCSGGGGGGGVSTPPPTSGGAGPGSAGQPPTAVADLRLQEQPFITTSVTLLWTAPSDPDTAQTGLAYEMRSATTTPIIDLATFQSATAVTAPAVGAISAPETLTITDLTPGTTYSVALRTSDRTNVSALSNIVIFTTLPKGDAPTQITDFTMIDEYIRYPLKLQWTAPTDPETNYTNSTPHLSYEIRYATTPITDETSWAAATLLATPPTPGAPGTTQIYNFTPPALNTVYSVAIRMSDGYQLGPISNIVAHTSAWFGTITTPTTWTATPYVTGAVRFEAPLTIEPGVTVKLGEFSTMTFAAPLTATGTAQSPITMTSVVSTAANYWQSIRLIDGSTGSSLSYVTIEKGGNIDGTLVAPMVDVQFGVSTIDQTTIQNGLGQGMLVTFPARPTLTNLTIANNGKNGAWYTGTLDAVYTLSSAAQPVFTGTTTITSSGAMTVTAGTVVKMDIGALLLVDGSFTTAGTSMSLVYGTSIRDDTVGTDPTPTDTAAPARGDWQAIRFRNGSMGTLAGGILRYGGSATSSTNTDAGMMKVDGATVLLDIFWFQHMNYGLEVHGAASTVELRQTIFLNTEAPIDPTYSLWNNPDNPGTVHYVRINPTFTGIPPTPGTFTGGAAVEYITIDNLGSGAETLTGWKIHDLSNTTFTFSNFTLNAGASVVVHTGSGTNSATDLYWGRGIPVWNDGGDFATLKNSTGTVIDEAAYE